MCLSSHSLIKLINLIEAHCACSISFKIINTLLCKLFHWTKRVFVFSSHFYKTIRYDLSCFYCWQRVISIYPPFKWIFFRVELNTIKWIFLGLKWGNKFLIFWGCCCGSESPKILQGNIGIESIKSDSEMMIKIENSISFWSSFFLWTWKGRIYISILDYVNRKNDSIISMYSCKDRISVVRS